MKGKGKKTRDSSDEESNSCPLMFIDFKSLDHSRTCPRYTSVLNRSEEESIGFEDLDPLQLELESLLVSVTQRQNQLKSEMDSLMNWQDSKPKEKKSSPLKASSDSSGKRSKQIDDRPSKKIKESSSSSSSSSSSVASYSSAATSSTIVPKTNIKSKSKNVKVQDYDHTDSAAEQSHPVHVRNDLPDKFWTFVDNYCSPVRTEHLQVLESLLKNYEDDSEYYKIPNLGKHYTLKWAQEDELENKSEDVDRNSNAGSESKKKCLSPSNNGLTERKSGKKNRNAKNEADKCAFGTLTQRLVSCLFEESLLSNSSSAADLDFSLDANEKNGFQLDKNIFKGINFGNASALEKRIKKELEEHGFLDNDLFSMSSSNDLLDTEDDEVYSELIKAQTELKALSKDNEHQLKELLEKAKKQFKQEELNKKLIVVENEIIDAYKRILSAKQKKRSPTKKERDAALKALKEREMIIQQMNN